MTKFLMMPVISLTCYAGSMAIDGNATRQCPSSQIISVPISVLDKSAPESNFCFSIGPPPSLTNLVGTTDIYKTQRNINWSPLASIWSVPPMGFQSPLISTTVPQGNGQALFPPPSVTIPVPPTVIPPNPPNSNSDNGVPEPGTLQLLATALISLLFFRIARKDR